jgi:predicted dehydrogenase
VPRHSTTSVAVRSAHQRGFREAKGDGATVSFGVIGAGGIARRKTIPAMLRAKHCKVVAVMDPENVHEIAEGLGIAKAYTTEAELLADPAVQAVYIASPVHCHLRHVAMSAEAGKHVLCEKPLALTLRQAKEAVDICRRSKVFLQEGYMMKFHGAHARIKQLIDEGRLGKMVYIRAQLSCWYPKIPGAWRQDPRLGGGGALVDMATHLYDLIELFAGPIRRLAALTGNLVHDYRSEDSSSTLLELKSGAHATIDCFYCIPDEASRTRLEIYGSRGAILAEGTIGQSQKGKLQGCFVPSEAAYDAAQNKDAARRFQSIPYAPVNPYTAECDYFAQCILDGRQPAINDGKNAVHIMSLVEKAYRSSKVKRFMTV